MAKFLKDGPIQEDMPVFRSRMSDLQLFDVIVYMRSLHDVQASLSQSPPPVLDGAYSYVALDGAIRVYDMERDYKIVKQIRIKGMNELRGIVASPKTGLLHVSFDGLDRADQIGGLACLDLATDELLWSHTYAPGVDSMALSPDGTTIFMPGGEADLRPDKGEWLILDALSGDERSRLAFGTSPHNSLVGPEGRFVYLAGARSNELGVLDAATNSIVRKIGPFSAGVRPFTLTSDGKLALVNVNALVGFEVADLASGEVLHRVEVEGAPIEKRHMLQAPSHGIALSPDEKEAWVSDVFNGFVHIFDVSGLPGRPKFLQSIPVRRPGLFPTWIQFNRGGRFVHVSNGAIIDATSREIQRWIAPSRYYMEVHFREGKPVAAFPRYGVGYANATWWSGD